VVAKLLPSEIAIQLAWSRDDAAAPHDHGSHPLNLVATGHSSASRREHVDMARQGYRVADKQRAGTGPIVHAEMVVLQLQGPVGSPAVFNARAKQPSTIGVGIADGCGRSSTECTSS
jgi:hypothetical protein